VVFGRAAAYTEEPRHKSVLFLNERQVSASNFSGIHRPRVG